MKVTWTAPANIAFVKYWGALDLEEVRPVNPSISMTLSRALTTTTVERVDAAADEILLVGPDGELRSPDERFARRALRHARRVADDCGFEGALRIATRNSFPTGAGIASSASGFAALTLAVRSCCGAPETSAEELSRAVRRGGSGSATRSVLGGYVEWPGDPDDPDPAARQLAPASHWSLSDLIVIVEEGSKEVSSREGHRRAPTSPYFETRLRLLPDRLAVVRAAIAERRLDLLGPVVEEEAIDLHLIAMSSHPAIHYWRPATLEVLAAARAARDRGIGVWATMDAGANVHLICEPADDDAVHAAVASLPGVVDVLRDRVGDGPALTDEHLL